MTTNTLTVINELSSIMQIEDLREREIRFRLWQDSNIIHVETTQLVIDRKYLTSQFEDELKYAMATKLAEELMEDCVFTTINDNEVTVSLTALKRCF